MNWTLGILLKKSSNFCRYLIINIILHGICSLKRLFEWSLIFILYLQETIILFPRILSGRTISLSVSLELNIIFTDPILKNFLRFLLSYRHFHLTRQSIYYFSNRIESVYEEILLIVLQLLFSLWQFCTNIYRPCSGWRIWYRKYFCSKWMDCGKQLRK